MTDDGTFMFKSFFERANVAVLYERHWRNDDITGLFGTGTMHAVFQAARTVFVEKHNIKCHAKNASQLFYVCLEYS